MAILIGFAIGLLTGVVGAVVVYLNKRSKSGVKDNTPPGQLEILSRLTGGLAHEIKNPLSIIKVNLKLISEDTDSGDIDRALRKIEVVRKETERVEHILENFLRFIGKPELQLAEHNINDLVGDIVDFYSPQAYRKSITTRFLGHTAPVVCNIDPAMIKQVLLNLMINAGQAISGGGELLVRTGCDDEFAIIEISDTGSGIDEDKIDKIFDAFYTSKSGGTGLGLATAKKIIDAHGGTISVESEKDKGTKFSIKLKLVNKDTK